jgi:predicted dehydrogenase
VSGSVTDSIRLGVVGVAGIGQAHLFAGSMLPEYELVAACDIADEPRDRAAADFGAAPFTDATELFASGTVDAVVIATPPATHAALVAAALDAGLHVYCEKPLMPTAAAGRELDRHARAADRVVQVGLQFRFQRSARVARDLIQAGEIGDIFRADLAATNWFRSQQYFTTAPWRGSWRASGGGVLMSQAVHQVDTLVWLAGLPSRVTAWARRARHDAQVEDDVIAFLEYPNGARGTLVASTTDPVGVDAVTLHGERGTLSIEGFRLRRATFGDGTRGAQQLTDESTEDFDIIPVEWVDVVEPGGKSEWFDMMLDCHRDFVSAIRAGRSAANPPAEASRSLELINALYLSAACGEPVTLPIDSSEYDMVFNDLCTGARELPTR